MLRRIALRALTATAVAALSATAATAASAAFQAPETAAAKAAAGSPACTYPDSTAVAPHVQPFIHCYTAGQIRTAYGVDAGPVRGDGQTIVLLVSSRRPAAAQEHPRIPCPHLPRDPK